MEWPFSFARFLRSVLSVCVCVYLVVLSSPLEAWRVRLGSCQGYRSPVTRW